MNQITKISLFLFIALAAVLQSCNKDACTAMSTYIDYQPIYMFEDDLRQPIETEDARELKKPGKIYFYNNYILINEYHQGIHVIDNSNPESPQNIVFIKVPGNEDIAVKDNILYADNFVDLVMMDFTDPSNPTYAGRVENMYPPRWTDDDLGMMVGYNEVEVTEEVPCNQNRGGWIGFEGDVLSSGGGGQSSSGSGQGGSMARFTIANNHLYVVDESNLIVYDVSNAADPIEVSESSIGWGIETIFPREDKLFIGTSSGMLIYDVATPSDPMHMSTISHMRACDPVVVQDDYAYVTLRSGTWCDGFSNQLDLIDIRDLYNPVLIESFEMKNPHGLAVKDNSLFLCEGEHGMKIFDIETPEELDNNQIDFIKKIHSYDVIALDNGYLLLIGEDGFYQYDYSDINNLQQVSMIPVVQ